MLEEADVNCLLSKFPPGISLAFAYGSGVVTQSGYNYNSSDYPMLDLILVVEDSEQWHLNNMRMNPTHYSSLIPLNAANVAKFQDKIPAYFWFNAYVPMDSPRFPNRLMKYGVICKANALRDLEQWNCLYLAGRLHKPVRILKSCQEMDHAIESNLTNAMRTALLMLPERFNEIDLYMTIASLSYTGDPRMYVGENPKKVVNLVKPVVPFYQKLYGDTYEALRRKVNLTRFNTSDRVCLQNVSSSTRLDLSLELPSTLKSILGIRRRARRPNGKPPQGPVIRAALASIVARSAGMQTMKGLFMVGLAKGTVYMAAKMGKRFLSKS